MRSCVGRLILLAVLAGGAFLAWQNRDELAERLGASRTAAVEVSPELAAQADNKLAALSAENGVRTVALTAPELQSLIEYRWGGLLPQDVSDPRVGLGQGRVTLEASVATARFHRVAELRDIIGILPDTTALRAVGSFVPLADGQVGLEVHDLTVASIPVPRRLIPVILERFPGSGADELPANAVVIPLPPGIRTLYVSGDTMVFVANPETSD